MRLNSLWAMPSLVLNTLMEWLAALNRTSPLSVLIQSLPVSSGRTQYKVLEGKPSWTVKDLNEPFSPSEIKQEKDDLIQ
jgi:hypothetical protein